MNLCPKCQRNTLIERFDSSSGFTERICTICGHYESNSPAFHNYPHLFNNLGETILAKMKEEASLLIRYGLTETEAENWLKQEPDFNKPVFRRRDDKLTEQREAPSNFLEDRASLQFIVPPAGVGSE